MAAVCSSLVARHELILVVLFASLNPITVGEVVAKD